MNGPVLPRERTELGRARRKAAVSAWLKIAFLGHAGVWFGVAVLLLLVAGPFVAAIVAVSWGILLGAHGFFTVAAPALRDRIVEREVARKVHGAVALERRTVEGRHGRALSELSASVAHEIRNPIAAAKSLVQQISEDPTSAANAEFAKVAADELDRVERSVSHLLRYAREEPLTLGETSLEEAVRAALETLNARIAASPVRVVTRFQGSTLLEGDADKLRRVFINLVGNAIEALAESGFPDPQVEVTGGPGAEGREAWVRVKDNGPGIEPERLPRIFDPFHTSKDSGTGLGLAITRKLVEAHGGSIEVDSSLGSGATFTVTLPTRAAPPE